MTREEIAEYSPDALLIDGFDDCIIGLAERIGFDGPVVAYDGDKIIEKLMEDMEVEEDDVYDGHSIEETKLTMAIEYYEFNIKGAWVGEYTPIFITTIL